MAAAINFTLFLFSRFLSNVPVKGSSDKPRGEYTCVNHFLASFPLLSRLVIISGVGRGVLMTDPAGLRGLQSPGLSTSTLAPSGEIVGKRSGFNQHPVSSTFGWLGFQMRRNGTSQPTKLFCNSDPPSHLVPPRHGLLVEVGYSEEMQRRPNMI